MTYRVMFINAIDPEELAGPPQAHLGVGYLASALRNAFGEDHFKFKVIDHDPKAEIRTFRPDIVAISSVTPNFNYASTYAKIAKSCGLPVIMGGVHISAVPTSLTDDMDIGVLGEGERTIVELLKIFEDRTCLDPDALRHVQGIVFRHNGRYTQTQQRPPIEPLDQIAMPARDLLNFDVMTILTSRGCPYRCLFCSTSCSWGNIRYFSAEYVVNEISHIVENYQVPHNFIQIWDDLFIADVRRLHQIAELLEQKRLAGTLKFWCHARANLVTDEVSRSLKRIGVRFVNMGLESGSPHILQYYKGSTVSLNDNHNAVKALKRHRIVPEGSFIIGAPHETREDVLKTLLFIKNHQLNAELYLLTPYPGTPLWDFALQKGLVSDSMDWDMLRPTILSDDWERALILSERLTREEICDLYTVFTKEQKRIKRQKMMKRALKHPIKVSQVLLKRFLT